MTPQPTLSGEISATARLAGPIVGGQLTLVGMSFTDTVMAGRIDATALGAVAVGSSVWASVMLTVVGVLLVLPPLVAEAQGAGRGDTVAVTTRQAFWMAQGLAVASIAVAAGFGPLLEPIGLPPELVPVAAGYLRALCWGVPAWAAYMVLRNLSEGLNASRPTLYFGVVGLAVNVAANWVLMYGRLGFPALGAVGCGYATAVVWWAQLAGIALYVARRPRYRHLALFARLERPDPRAIGRLLKLGVPIGVMTLMEVSMFTLGALFIGRIGTTEVAGHQVALNFAALTFMVPLGISMAISVRVGHAAGRRDPVALRWAAGAGLAMAMAAQLLSAAVMLLVPHRVASIYTDDPAVVAIAVELLFLAAIFQLSDGVQVSTAGALRGLKDTRVPAVMTVVAYWLVGIPLGLALGFRWGLGARGLWMGLIAGLTVAAALLALRFRGLLRRLAGAGGRPA